MDFTPDKRREEIELRRIEAASRALPPDIKVTINAPLMWQTVATQFAVSVVCVGIGAGLKELWDRYERAAHPLKHVKPNTPNKTN